MANIEWKKRTKTTKGVITRLRREGYIPCVIYAKGKGTELGAISKRQFDAIVRTSKRGAITTTVFDLEGDKTCKAILKEIQYHPTNYEILHLDFLEFIEENPVKVKIPVEFVNTADCVGIKLGGFLRHIKRHVPVRCLPKDIPESFKLDVKEVGIRQSKRVKDLEIPEQITCLLKQEDVVAAVVKR